MNLVRFYLLIFLVFVGVDGYSQKYISIGTGASAYEETAAKELQRYMYLLYGEFLPIHTQPGFVAEATFAIGTPATNPSLFSTFRLSIAKDNPGLQGYLLKKIPRQKGECLVIAANDPIGCLYGVYGLLDEHYGVGFYLGGDVLPEPKKPFVLAGVDEIKNPATGIRGLLPWTNFPQSATVYSWADWQFIIDQMAKMRMNMLHIHNYNGQNNHNEMFHNFSYNGFMSRVWMPTASTGHFWACPPWDVNQYRFGASSLFDDEDFGADCALHNQSLTNEEVFRKGANLFRRVIDYAHQRGVKIALGLDIDLVMPEYKANAYDDGVIDARINQVVTDYPGLDYLVMFVSEMINDEPEKLDHWKYIFGRMYSGMKEKSPHTGIAVSGWGLRRELALTLPKDVIAAPISTYTSSFEDGSIYGEREYWGCPWLERDMFSSNYYYPYEMDLSGTIQAWKKRAPNMKGFYCLSWRLTDAVDAKMSYIAKAPWDTEEKYQSSYDVYREYAERNYGQAAAPEITDIINQNEPISSKAAECQGTARFTGEPVQNSDYLYNLRSLRLERYGQTICKLDAANYDEASGVSPYTRKDGSSYVQQVNHGDWIMFRNVDFGQGITGFTAEVQTSNPMVCVEMHVDSPDSPVTGTVEIDKVIGWARWREMTGRTFYTTGIHDVYFVFKSRLPQTDQYQLATDQLKVIDGWIRQETNPGHVARLKMLRCRIAAAQNFMDLNIRFPGIKSAAELPSLFPEWVENFTHRVNDISSLGNVQSIQNRYVKLRYVGKEKELQDSSEIKFPVNVQAKGLKNGTLVSWENQEPNIVGVNIYRNGVKINANPLPQNQTFYIDRANGKVTYNVETVTMDGRVSQRSASSTCLAGNADNQPPHVVCISPAGSRQAGQTVPVKVRLLDNRTDDLLHARLFYRYATDKQWHSMDMQRRTKAVFTADTPYRGGLMTYYVEASDGKNTALFPPAAPQSVLSVIENNNPGHVPLTPPVMIVTAGQQIIQWKQPETPANRYHIYRSHHPGFKPSSATFLTYVSGDTFSFRDMGRDFDGAELKGKVYYCVTSVDEAGNESAPGGVVARDRIDK